MTVDYEPSEALGTGALVNLRSLRGAVRRRRRLWLATAIVGAALGAGLHSVLPARYQATASVYLDEPAGNDQQQALETDVSLLQTREVAAAAIAKLGLRTSPASFLDSLRVPAPTDPVLPVTMTAASSALAVAEDNALVNAFISYRSAEFQQLTNNEVSLVVVEEGPLTKEISSLQKKTTPNASGSDGLSANLQTTDVTQLGNDESQLEEDQTTVQLYRNQTATILSDSRVLDPAAVVTRSTKKVLVKNTVSGFIGGLALGLSLVTIGALLSTTVSRRQDIAEALGVPVELSIAGRHRRRRRLRARKLYGRPPPGLDRLVGLLRRALVASPTSAVTAVTIEASETSALALGYLASSLAADGERVTVIDLTPDRPMAALFRLRGSDTAPRLIEGPRGPGAPGSITVISVPDDHGWRSPPLVDTAAEAVLILAAVDPAIGAAQLGALAPNAVAIVGAGKVTATLLATVGALVRHAGVDLTAAVVIDADEDDDTLGILEGVPAPPGTTDGRFARVRDVTR